MGRITMPMGKGTYGSATGRPMKKKKKTEKAKKPKRKPQTSNIKGEQLWLEKHTNLNVDYPQIKVKRKKRINNR